MKKHFLLALYLASSLVAAEIVDFKVLNQGGSGPYNAIAATEKSLADYVVYRPKNLSQAAKDQ